MTSDARERRARTSPRPDHSIHSHSALRRETLCRTGQRTRSLGTSHSSTGWLCRRPGTWRWALGKGTWPKAQCLGLTCHPRPFAKQPKREGPQNEPRFLRKYPPNPQILARQAGDWAGARQREAGGGREWVCISSVSTLAVFSFPCGNLHPNPSNPRAISRSSQEVVSLQAGQASERAHSPRHPKPELGTISADGPARSTLGVA